MTELEALEWCKQHSALIKFTDDFPKGCCRVSVPRYPSSEQVAFTEAVDRVKYFVDQIENPQPLKAEDVERLKGHWENEE